MRAAARILLGFVLLLVVLAGAGAAYESYAEARDVARFPPPGRLVDIGGRRLHLRCIGPPGGPTVLMVAGGAAPSAASYAAQDRIAKFAQVCSYDRAGLGWSDAAPGQLGLSDQVRDLEQVLSRGSVRGPYVFVPESFGGLIALGFATRHRDEVAGAVFVDSVDGPLWFSAMDAIMRNRGFFVPNLLELGRRFGIVRIALPYLAPRWTQGLSPAMRGQLFAVFARPNPGTEEAPDLYSHTPSEQRPVPGAGFLGSRPVIVLRHGQYTSELSPEFQKGWIKAQLRLAALSSSSVMIVATANGHEIAEENPDLVAGSVKRVMSSLQSHWQSCQAMRKSKSDVQSSLGLCDGR